MTQLAFALPLHQAYRREDFFPSPSNAAALATIENPETHRLLLIGAQGAGKTHLSHVFARHHSAEFLTRDTLPARLPTLPPRATVVIDGADAPGDEPALFHLMNLLATTGRLLLTAETPPRDWGVTLPDLFSRLQAIPTLRLDPPDDALLSAVLVKLFADRQITVPPNLIPFLISRMERSFAAARALVATLDAEGLAAGRKVNRTLAAEVLDRDSPA